MFLIVLDRVLVLVVVVLAVVVGGGGAGGDGGASGGVGVGVADGAVVVFVVHSRRIGCAQSAHPVSLGIYGVSFGSHSLAEYTGGCSVFGTC